MKLLVCGGRNFSDYLKLRETLSNFHTEREITLMITGACKGADLLADGWAAREGIPRALFPANWAGEGKAAGFIRNRRMLKVCNPHVVLAFPGGHGTADTIKLAQYLSIETIEVSYE